MYTLLAAFLTLAQQAPLDAAPASARTRVLVVPQEVPDGWVDRMYGALAARGLLTADQRDRVGVDHEDDAAFAPVRIDAARDRLLTAGAAMRAFEYAEVRTALDEAEALLLRTQNPLAHTDTYRELLLLRAGLNVSEGDLDAARPDLVLLSRLDPALTALHPGLYPPPLVDAYASARQAQGVGATGAVVAIAPREDAASGGAAKTMVAVDAERATVGARTARLAPGPHVIVVSAPGRVTFAQRVDLKGGRTAVIAPYLPAPGAPDARAKAKAALLSARGPDASAAAQRLAALAGCTAVVVLGPSSITVYPAQGAATQIASNADALSNADAVRLALLATESVPLDDADEALPVGLYTALGVGALAVLTVVVAGGITAIVLTVQALSDPVEDPEPLAAPRVAFCCGPPSSTTDAN